MSYLRAWCLRFAGLFGKERKDRELAEELESHLQMHIEDNLRSGMNPEEARRQALIRLGGIEQTKERYRNRRGISWLETLLQDVRFALRMLRKSPGFTVVAVLTLALGIGANTAIFSVFNAVLLRPLPYPDPERLVWLMNYDERLKVDSSVLITDFAMWRDRAQSFEKMAAYVDRDLAFVTTDQTSQERIASIAGDFWSITGAQPVVGRLFEPGEPNTIVLTYGFFERRFGSDPNVVGRTMAVNGYPVTVTGVLPRAFHFVLPQVGSELKEPEVYMAIPNSVDRPRVFAIGPVPGSVRVVGKRRPDIAIEGARAEMETIYAQIAQENPAPIRRLRKLRVAPLKEKIIGNTEAALRILLAAVGFVLLIATANIANLLLARASTRQREVAIRAALGAGRARVMRQLLSESTLLALIGGGAGLLLARWAITAMVQLWPQAVPRLEEAKIDGWVTAFTLVVSLLTGILFGSAPAILLWKANGLELLKGAERTSSPSQGRLRIRGLLVAVELALATVLLLGAGLMLKSFWRMYANVLGFAPESILVARVSLYGPQYEGKIPSTQAYAQEVLRRVENAAPEVKSAGISCSTWTTFADVDGAPAISSNSASSDDRPLVGFRFMSPGYLRTAGVSLLRGHWPTEDESRDGAVLVNESFSRMLLGGRDPMGRRVVGSGLPFTSTIVGVVADFKWWQLDAEPFPELYAPYQRSPTCLNPDVFIRTAGDPFLAAPSIRRLISEIDRSQPVYGIQTLEQFLSSSVAPRRFNLFLLGAFAAVALLLALVGTYGVIAYSVTQRTREIGIRMALGARRGAVVRMAVRQGMGVALAGIAVGLLAALWLSRLVASLLYDVKPNDPLTFAAIAIALAVTALIACWSAAAKAVFVDPNIALRYE